MLAALGIDSIDALFDDIPAAVRADWPRPAGAGAGADARQRRLERSPRATAWTWRSFLGAGVYRHHIPAIVDAILSRGEFYTAYTPYQPEISQGTLQTIYEYQSLHRGADRPADVVSASHYDGAAATAEAALMTIRATRPRRASWSAAPSIGTTSRRRATYFAGGGLALEELPTLADGTTDLAALERALGGQGDPVAGVLLGQPNAFGILEPMAEAGRLAHAAGALFVAVVEPVSLAVLASPGEFGADIAAGEGQPLGIAPAVRRPVPGHPGRAPRRSSARSRAASSGGPRTSTVGAPSS